MAIPDNPVQYSDLNIHQRVFRCLLRLRECCLSDRDVLVIMHKAPRVRALPMRGEFTEVVAEAATPATAGRHYLPGEVDSRVVERAR